MNRLIYRVFPLIGIIVILFSIGVNYQLGFYTVSEAELYIPFFLSNTSFLYKLYYYPTTDLYYRAREISNIFNYIDTYFLLFSVKIGFPHFLSGVYYLFLSCIYFCFIFFGRKVFGRRTTVLTTLGIVVYLTLPAIFLSGMYFRPSKMLIAFGITCSFFTLYLVYKQYWKMSKKTSFLIGIMLTLLMGISDEQGIFYSIIFAQIGIFTRLITKQKTIVFISAGLLCGNVLLWIYRSYLGPYIVYLVTGLSAVPWGIEDLKLFQINDIINALSLFHTYVYFFLGKSYILISIIGVLTLYGFIVLMRRGLIVYWLLSCAFLGLLFVEFILFFHILSIRHPVILWPEYTLIYYPIPFFSFLFAAIFLGALELQKRLANGTVILSIVFFVWIVANVYSLFTHVAMLTSPLTKTSVYYGYAWHFLPALKQLDKPVEYFHLDHEGSVRALRKAL